MPSSLEISLSKNETEWRDMRSAPKDGSQFVVGKYRPSGGWRFSIAKVHGDHFLSEAMDTIYPDDTRWVWSKINWPKEPHDGNV